MAIQTRIKDGKVRLVFILIIIFAFIILFNTRKQYKEEKSLSYLHTLNQEECLQKLIGFGLEIPDCYDNEELLALHTKTLIDFWYKNGDIDGLPFSYTGYYELAQSIKVIISLD